MDREKAIEIVRSNFPNGRSQLSEALITLIPELKENGDRIRKELIEHFRWNAQILSDFDNKDVIAWLEKQGELIEKPTKEQVWDYCNKISHEWWQITMDRWKSLTDKERKKYNLFIGFNEFSDMLMNITAGALFQLRDTGKLEYEEGSLLLEKPKDTPKPIEVTNEKKCEQKSKWNDTEINIETYLMFVSYVQMYASYRKNRKGMSYIDTAVAPRVYCKDGYSLSVQCHYGSHCAFDDTPIAEIPYPTKIGKEVVSAETDSEDLEKYGINSIEEIQSLIDKHGGIDFVETTKKFIERARTIDCK